jgi:hypothetical protein
MEALKIPFTKNTNETRIFLESEGYRPLRFFMDKEYVRPSISIWANAKESWKEKDYSTFNMDEWEPWCDDFESSLEEFKVKVKQYYESNK